MQVTKLPLKFEGKGEVAGYAFEQVAESELGYVYKVTGLQGHHFEVFRKKSVPLCLDFATRTYSDTEAKEVYPNSRQFGLWAWNYIRMESALLRLNSFTPITAKA